MTDQQVAAGDRGFMEAVDQRVLGGLVEVDHYVPAEDHVEFPPEADGVHQVEGLENDIVPQDGGDGVTIPRIVGKILPLPFRGDGIRQLIGPALGLGQHVLGDIRGQDTGVPILGLGAEKLLDIDGDIVRLLSAGAAGAPNGQYLVALVPADQVGQDGLLEELEVVGLFSTSSISWGSRSLSSLSTKGPKSV